MHPSPLPTRSRRTVVLAVAVAVLITVVGVLWAKWLPYAEKAVGLATTRTWPGTSPLTAGGTGVGLAAAWSFATSYAEAVWRALLVSLLVAAAVDALVPRTWLATALSRGGRWRQATLGGLASTPTMMCSCCTAPVVVSLRRSGVPLPAATAYWLGNPLLNPAVLVFLFLLAPWPWGLTRLVVGVLLVVGLAALLPRRTLDPAAAPLPTDAPEEHRSLPVAYLRSLLRLTLVLVPEYAVTVLAVGLVSGWLSQYGERAAGLGVLGTLLVVAVATLLVIPTGGEIPVVLALGAAGVGAGVVGGLLVALPALSLPSAVMVARALGAGVVATAAGGVVVASLLAGALLTLLT